MRLKSVLKRVSIMVRVNIHIIHNIYTSYMQYTIRRRARTTQYTRVL